jgi:hypothetical protein
MQSAGLHQDCISKRQEHRLRECTRTALDGNVLGAVLCVFVFFEVLVIER